MKESLKMFTITFKRGDATWTAQAEIGETLFEVAKGCDAPVETLCHGIGACVRCKVRLLEGTLAPPTPLERDRLGNIFHLTQERLSCQSYIQGDCTLEIPAPRKKKSGKRGQRRSITSDKGPKSQ
jgi:ferredoxin, 2Fe-2S